MLRSILVKRDNLREGLLKVTNEIKDSIKNEYIKDKIQKDIDEMLISTEDKFIGLYEFNDLLNNIKHPCQRVILNYDEENVVVFLDLNETNEEGSLESSGRIVISEVYGDSYLNTLNKVFNCLKIKLDLIDNARTIEDIIEGTDKEIITERLVYNSLKEKNVEAAAKKILKFSSTDYDVKTVLVEEKKYLYVSTKI